MTRRTFLASALAASPSPLFAGTYLQLQVGHLDWPASRWESLFDAFSQLRLSRVIIQWTRNDDVSYIAVLPLIFEQAGKHRIRIQLGLVHSSQFWGVEGTAMLRYFSDLYQLNTTHIQELQPWTRHPSFGGWYIPQEFDDVRWNRQIMKERGGDFLKVMSQSLHKVAPGSSVSVSAFSNGVTQPQMFAELWKDALKYSRVNELLFQDGVGVRKLTIPQSGQYAHALRQKLGKKITPVIEIFEQVETDPFRAIPASAERIHRQLQVARSAGLPPSVAFSIPEYMSPLGGRDANQLFQYFKQK